jgi:hypothetical protein
VSKRGSGSSARAGGFEVVIQGKKQTYFRAAGGEYRNLQDQSRVISSQMAQKLFKNNKVPPLSKSKMDEIKKRRQKERDAKPDYELGMGIPGGNKEYRKTARNSRLVSRMQSRRRR